MGLLGKLLGNKAPVSPEERQQQARELLSQVEALATTSPEKARKLLAGKSLPYYELLCIDGELHQELRQVARSLWTKPPPIDAWPAVEMLPWATWHEPRVTDVIARARASQAGILYCRPPRKRAEKNVVAELEALRAFAGDERLVMLVIGEEEMFFRCTFLIENAARLQGDREEVADEVEQTARKLGYRCSSL